jgi:hypothetical protein
VSTGALLLGSGYLAGDIVQSSVRSSMYASCDGQPIGPPSRSKKGGVKLSNLLTTPEMVADPRSVLVGKIIVISCSHAKPNAVLDMCRIRSVGHRDIRRVGPPDSNRPPNGVGTTLSASPRKGNDAASKRCKGHSTD